MGEGSKTAKDTTEEEEEDQSLLDGLKQSLETRTAWSDAWPQLRMGKCLHFCASASPSVKQGE